MHRNDHARCFAALAGWVIVMLLWQACAWGQDVLHAAGTRPAAGDYVSDRVHIFYYPWYGAPPPQNGYVHWQQGEHSPPDDIASNFYPALGPYSSSDPKVLQQHMAWIRQAHAGVLTVSWWGQGSYEDHRVPAILDAAQAAGLKVNFHMEPYPGFTPDRFEEDVIYLLKRYGSHPAFYRSGGKTPVFYIFEALRHPADQWNGAIRRLRGRAEPLLLIAQTTNINFIKDGDFDGGYTYDVLTPFKNPDFLRSWNDSIAANFKAAGKIFIPSVGPGYCDERAVPASTAHFPQNARTRDDGTAATYDAEWTAAIKTNPPFITITSFNEWHEGTQIEPAMEKKIPGYTYPGYKDGPLQYIQRTAQWVDRWIRQKEDKTISFDASSRP